MCFEDCRAVLVRRQLLGGVCVCMLELFPKNALTEKQFGLAEAGLPYSMGAGKVDPPLGCNVEMKPVYLSPES